MAREEEVIMKEDQISKNECDLEDGAYWLYKRDLRNLLPKLKGSAVKIWLAYLANPAEEFNPDPNAEYISAFSTLSNKDIISATGLSEKSVTKGRNALCAIGELERLAPGVYKIVRYRRIRLEGKSINE